ncbi:hypothetical protein PGT21_003815 [Puccinia graminis f. sp. tritici]|uniref:Uncharacterized protein n=2 Tax=Puccinia graminis f. sp. tritici TaxID=56615 RepID=A0A5B0QZM0_PUCGR|nr:hypothetical protein PGT21_003815 [Puccinia graminis f. sp. tritici]KAA1135322.1 hypothetical protein PGTUg99_010937 [Puccinia graminis f. sp. tritici]
MASSTSMDELSPTPSVGPSIEFSLANGQIFQRVIENPARFNLTPTDRLLLEEGRQSMINRTRYGFLLGATLSPLPLFRGQYAINNLRKLPPLMDRVTQKPNPAVIRARLFWIAQSVVLTTLGSGLGTWLGFKLGLRSMERSLSSHPGCRERVMEAFSQARKELESAPLDQQPSLTARNLPSSQPSQRMTIQNENHDRSFQDQEEDLLRPSPRDLSNLNNTSQTPDSPQTFYEPAGSSRWEQLRRSPQSHPSTWQTIREQNLKQPPNLSSPSSSSALETSSGFDGRPSPLGSSNLDPPQSQDEFEKLLERERNLSAGLLHPSDRYSSTKP